MEAMNDWLSFFTEQTTLDHNAFAMKRFCPAKAEHDWQDTTTLNFEMELMSSPSDDTTTTTTTTLNPVVFGSEANQLVNNFINVDQQDTRLFEAHQYHHHQQQQRQDGFFDEMETLSVLNDVFLDVPMFEASGSTSSSKEQVHQEVVHCNNNTVEEVESSGTNNNNSNVDQGLHLVHLLLACAEAVGCRDTQVATSLLNQVWSFINPFGDSLQRVSYCFAMALKSRLTLLNCVNANGTLFANGGGNSNASFVSREEKIEAFHLLHKTTPYLDFGFLAANEAITQASQRNDYLHIVDLGMEHTLQWPSLLRTLASRPHGPPKVRITGLIDSRNFFRLEASTRLLVEEAHSLGVVLQFNLIAEPITPSLLTRENLELKEGEALFFNSITHLHKFVKESRGSLKTILQSIKKLNPILLTVVEQDANHNGPFFLGRFLESLHYYSAIFDSLEESLPRNSLERMKVENNHFAEEIRNVVAWEGAERVERHERADQWRRQLGRAGFQAMGMKCMSQVKMMLSLYGVEGYTLSSEKGCLLLGWKGRPIMLASAWQVHNVVNLASYNS